MSAVRAIDPALAKLLDELPRTNPDEPERPMAVVWCPFFQGEHLVPVGVETTIEWGQWYGPPMPAREAIIYARYGAREGSHQFDEPSDLVFQPGPEHSYESTIIIHVRNL